MAIFQKRAKRRIFVTAILAAILKNYFKRLSINIETFYLAKKIIPESQATNALIPLLSRSNHPNPVLKEKHIPLFQITNLQLDICPEQTVEVFKTSMGINFFNFTTQY